MSFSLRPPKRYQRRVRLKVCSWGSNMRQGTLVWSIASCLFLFSVAVGQTQRGEITGTVHVQPSGLAARNAVVTIAELKKTALTDESGHYEFHDIPAGTYQLIAHLDRVPDVVKTITLTTLGPVTTDFELALAPVNEQVTVTASGSAE